MTSIVTTHASTRTTGHCVTPFFVCNYGVRTALDTLIDVDKSNILLDIESLRALGGKLEQLLQVEDLDMVTNTLGSDNEAVTNNLDLTPDDGVIVGRKTANVLKLAVLGELGEGSTVSLTDGNLNEISLGSQVGTMRSG